MLKEFFPTLDVDAAGFAKPLGLYDPQNDHDSCGVGFIARIDGDPRHDIVASGVRILINLEHRGALGGDKSTGDGAGIMMRIPDGFFRAIAPELKIKLPSAGDYAVGMLFLPLDDLLAARCMTEIHRIARAEGCPVLGWREVPVDPSVLGDLAGSTRPSIRQVFLSRGETPPDAFERRLYVIRRLAEKAVSLLKGGDYSPFYACSLSSKKIVYKGMLTGAQLARFFPDLSDERFKSPYSVVHQRYSTNTLPTWPLAHPFRFAAHNGEINTLRGNINRMRSREATLSSPLFGDDVAKLLPILDERGSDSAIFDNALELLALSGRSLPHAVMMMIPEAWGPKFQMSEDKRGFYEYHAAFMEPWDGPAAMAFCDDRYLGATLDRNGLRPCRYTVTKDGVVVMASETGVVDVPAESISRHGRLQPGKMLLIDLQQKRIVPDSEVKSSVSRQKPYRNWVRQNKIELRGLFSPSEVPAIGEEELRRLQQAFGYSEEEVRVLINPMASQGQEAIGSMGDDSGLAILSDRPQSVFSYFRQLFAQVTNPPIDPLREELVMSLNSFVGRERNLLDETPEHSRMLRLVHPLLTPGDMERLRTGQRKGVVAHTVHALFPAEPLGRASAAGGRTPGAAGGSGEALESALDAMFADAVKAIEGGATIVVVSDRGVDAENAPIPALLASAGLHHHLIRKGLRTQASIVVETGEAREVMHFALLLGYGANAVCPYVALATVRDLAENGLLEIPSTSDEATERFVTAVKKGLLKTFSRMGISTLRSFLGAQIFEAVGLSRELVDRYFSHTASRIEGIGLSELAREATTKHAKAFPSNGRWKNSLESGGVYQFRVDGERHLWTPESIYKLQAAVRQNDYAIFKEYAAAINAKGESLATLRSLFHFRETTPVPLSEVEPVESIMRRFVTAAMSFGSIGKETHETIAVAMNRIGGRSNSGEGGEDPARYIPLPNGDSLRSKIKQVASGRFGVTTEYLVNADELQIKMAQGAKPGEGGQLPGHKVTPDIARVRHTTPYVTLISPPPHHDIYSIEDLAQLIYDLKSVNPKADVSVKLVSEVGVGTIASGVAKAKADLVLISGSDGGTGASPLTSIRHCGLPWELGLAETQQSLILNRLRDRIRVQVDGQLKTGRDLAIAALMGAEEYGFGTTVLVSLGCVMMRKCHLNTCPVGVATQDPELRKRFGGAPEYVVRFFRFISEEFREQMAALGFRTVDEMIGRVDLLEVEPAIEHWKRKGLDFSSILMPVGRGADLPLKSVRKQEHEVHKQLDYELIEKAKAVLDGKKKKVAFTVPVRNVNRTVGAALSGEVVKRFGLAGLPEGSIDVTFEGSVGQSFGAFLANGVSFQVKGDANDFLGKGMSGGRIVVNPPKGAGFEPHKNVIVGNVVLYGATAGEVYLHGTAGERFCVRNSGATAVVEGVGDHGCEYMTGGKVVVLGRTGSNFAAGMSGGVAYVYDDTELFDTRCNLDMVDLETVWQADDVKTLRTLIENHHRHTGSVRAGMILDNWEARLPLFVKVMPIDYRKAMERMALEEKMNKESVSATEEVFRG